MGLGAEREEGTGSCGIRATGGCVRVGWLGAIGRCGGGLVGRPGGSVGGSVGAAEVGRIRPNDWERDPMEIGSTGRGSFVARLGEGSGVAGE